MNGETYQVSGLAWMDHEFFTNQLEVKQAGWDWFSLQPADDTELMLFSYGARTVPSIPFPRNLRRPAREIASSRSHGLHIDTPQRFLKGPVTSATYPVRWKISVPKLGIELEADTALKSQELTGQSKWIPNYWEGAISVSGHKEISPLKGSAIWK